MLLAQSSLTEAESNDETATSCIDAVPSWLHAHDVQDLRWFFAGGALVAIEESTFARQLERASLMGYGFRPCRRCGGTSKPWRNGTGFVPLGGVPYRKALLEYQRREAKAAGLSVAQGFAAEKLRLLGVEVTSQRRLDQLFPELPALLCRPCPACQGIGVVQKAHRQRGPITARPTGSSKRGSEGPAVTLDEASLERHGRVSRRLTAVTLSAVAAPEILQSFLQPGGGYSALWANTEAGRRMLEDNPRGLHAEALFANIREQERKSPDRKRKGLLDAAQRDAIGLVKSASTAWNRVVLAELVDHALFGTYGALVEAKAKGLLAQYGGLSAAARHAIIGLVREEEALRYRRRRLETDTRGKRGEQA